MTEYRSDSSEVPSELGRKNLSCAHEIPAQRTTVMLNSNLLVISRGSWPTSYDHLFLFILYLP